MDNCRNIADFKYLILTKQFLFVLYFWILMKHEILYYYVNIPLLNCHFKLYIKFVLFLGTINIMRRKGL